MTRMLVWR
ncbi:hypothetical protein E2C01_077130 [Portunus trituberculatus]|uniref:Uncharacterized protein n=1 Tax=Portunus trituberculatus TaxID=210409 RepID=A0A5B7IAK7_PORTR|nr:hypothetical protein [Portunus trituberculatus]